METLGKYFIFLGKLFVNTESFKTYFKLTIDEAINIGINSIFLVSLVSFFMGAVTTIQTAYNLISPLIPDYVISLVVRDMTILELAPTIIGVIYA
ncbi:MAG: ABC transporter permease, partial [Fulvivirga sp.]